MPDTPSTPSTPPTAIETSRVLQSMLDRLFSSIMTGPGMNCRPHNSRQRLDLDSLKNLHSATPSQALRLLLSETGKASVEAAVVAPKSVQERAARRFGRIKKTASEEAESPEEKQARQAWTDQQNIIHKFRVIADEAQTYENDTGVDVLHLGFPILSIPPGVPGPDGQASTRRILAPMCFMPLSITIKAGAKATVELSCTNDDIDRIQPNQALLSWVEQFTGKKPESLFNDESGSDPWREICELVKFIAAAAKVEVPAVFDAPSIPESLNISATPRTDALPDKPAILTSSVLGLFPSSNQSLLRDTREMMQQPDLGGPVRSFIRHDQSPPQDPPVPTPERLVAACDPCQAKAVDLARSSSVLVIHGPPGTGKSQTITNIIGDHLARGERVLFVCDKRTAVDVVANRLEALGLSSLCAVVHDPQRDQKPLYMAIRSQLEALTESTSRPESERDIRRIDTELESLLSELSEYHGGLMHAPEGKDTSLSDLIGLWLSIRGPATQGLHFDETNLREVHRADFERSTVQLRELFDRAASIDYAANPWRTAADSTLDVFLSVPAAKHRDAMSACCAAARAADGEAPATPFPAIADHPIEDQAKARSDVASQVKSALASVDASIRAFWANADPQTVVAAAASLGAVETLTTHISSLKPDPQLAATLNAASLPLPALSTQILAIEQYLAIAGAWWKFLAFGKNSAAKKVLTPLGLALTPENAANALSHLKAFRATTLLNTALTQATGQAHPAADPAASLARFAAHLQVVRFLQTAATSPLTSCCVPFIKQELTHQNSGIIQQSAQHLKALTELQTAIEAARFFSVSWTKQSLNASSASTHAREIFDQLQNQFETLDDCLRITDSLSSLPAGLSAAAKQLLKSGTNTAVAMKALLLGIISAEISHRLDAAPKLKSVDARRIDAIFTRVRELDLTKRDLCRDLVLHTWTSRCRDRLLAATGSRLNSEGANVKQRLFVKGSKALRLRQVIAMGSQIPGGDPLMDLRPVWMASPETVAQIFSRTPIFDAVIFDEASQVRLEEALPVLTRGKRIIIAGDPKQLPPTRFFESTIADTQTEAAETEAELFEQVQADTEDLLSAALSMDVQQSYLDVHYRSRSGDLIEFSNHYFYSSRLQAIPGHPSRKATTAPLRLVPVQGIYEDRANEIEAQAAVNLVKELLNKPEPPSIGIGCFNITQRDLITDLLDESAAEDKDFGAKLAAARTRRSQQSFEGLFVKNLENVQGDERDHIIISTTYGPDPNGKFYRRFGPLAQPGGGRRLNVLVTRARQEVHVISSIPAAAYRSLPPVPEGTTPGGAWLLFSYLKFAEDLARVYEHTEELEADTKSSELVTKRMSAAPSLLAESLAMHLAEQSKLSSTIYWGNEGFCIDVATPSPDGGTPHPVGILTDFSRFSLAGDPVRWDIFRTDVFAQLGWQLQRIWSPTVVRDPEGVLNLLSQKAMPHKSARTSSEDSANPVQ